MTDLSNADRIVLLAATIEDYLPGPWMGRREWSAEGPSEKRLCKRCEGQGAVDSRQGRVPCEPCGGKGSVFVDAYTGRVVARAKADEEITAEEIRATLAAEKEDWLARKRRRDRMRHLYAGLDAEGPRDGEDWADVVIRRKAELFRAGDYARLERMSRQLPEREGCAFWAVYGPRAADRVAGPRLRASAERGLRLLDNLMPNARVPGWLLEGPSPRSRDDEIVRLNGDGLPQAEIALRVGVSQQTVSRVLRGVAA